MAHPSPELEVGFQPPELKMQKWLVMIPATVLQVLTIPAITLCITSKETKLYHGRYMYREGLLRTEQTSDQIHPKLKALNYV